VLRDPALLRVRVLRQGVEPGRPSPEADRPHHGRQNALAPTWTFGTPFVTAGLHRSRW
jgi:hypothetical protein